MKIIGILCEYNPFHLGHKKQLEAIRAEFGPDCGIVCLMSGNFVQRGKPAIFDKSVRAKAALLSGADLVLELPVTAALSSAEGFAAAGVRILSSFCHRLCFGAETGDEDGLMAVAQLLLSPEFPPVLKTALASGISFPAARQKALEALGGDASLLSAPNNLLGVEYCKAILVQKSEMKPFVLRRTGDYHSAAPDLENPSATYVRKAILSGENWAEFVPEEARLLYAQGQIADFSAGERAILCRLWSMTEGDFQALPYGGEGLWRKFQRESQAHADLEEILQAVKSKRYTRTRLDRMLLCAFLGLTEEMLATPVPYLRALGATTKGRAILRHAREGNIVLHAGEQAVGPYWELEQRCQRLYGLFTQDSPTLFPESDRRLILVD